MHQPPRQRVTVTVPSPYPAVIRSGRGHIECANGVGLVLEHDRDVCGHGGMIVLRPAAPPARRLPLNAGVAPAVDRFFPGGIDLPWAIVAAAPEAGSHKCIARQGCAAALRGPKCGLTLRT